MGHVRNALVCSIFKVIKQDDVIESVADALQYISYFHPMDYIRALGRAYDAEQGPAAGTPSPRS